MQTELLTLSCKTLKNGKRTLKILRCSVFFSKSLGWSKKFILSVEPENYPTREKSGSDGVNFCRE